MSAAAVHTAVPSTASASVSSTVTEDLTLNIEFGGGLHLLFNSQPKHTIKLPSAVSGTGRKSDVRYLIRWMKDELLSDRERVDMFGDGEGV